MAVIYHNAKWSRIEALIFYSDHYQITISNAPPRIPNSIIMYFEFVCLYVITSILPDITSFPCLVSTIALYLWIVLVFAFNTSVNVYSVLRFVYVYSFKPLYILSPSFYKFKATFKGIFSIDSRWVQRHNYNVYTKSIGFN